jgi:hypothetical protein
MVLYRGRSRRIGAVFQGHISIRGWRGLLRFHTRLLESVHYVYIGGRVLVVLDCQLRTGTGEFEFLLDERRLPREAGTARYRGPSVQSLQQFGIALAPLDGLQFSLQPLVLVLVVPDLVGESGAVARVQLLDKLGDEVGILGGFLDGRVARAGRLALS